jgi:hypothetical protein
MRAGSIRTVLLIWLLITAREFAFGYHANEVSVLPCARHLFEPGWLANDWYLNSDASYREAFNFILGALIHRLGFEYAAHVGRLIAYLCVATALYAFFRTLRLPLWLGVLVLLGFLYKQGLVADEWIVGGVETKTFAYALAFLSLSAFLREQYLLGFASAGAAISFHALVGMYALFCTMVALLLNRPWRSQLRVYATRSWPLLVAGFFGWQAAIKHVVHGGADARKAWDIYVLYRNPHHLVPSAWSGHGWMVLLILATCLFVAAYVRGRSRAVGFIAAYALGSVVLFLCGLGLYAVGETPSLRFYWFRFPDVMVPFMTLVLLAIAGNEFVEGRLSVPILTSEGQSTVRGIVRRAGPVLMVIATVVTLAQSLHRLEREHGRWKESRNDERTIRPVLEWIAENTPRDAVFLVDPSVSEFHVYAQRAMFVAFKHIPRSAPDILEWQKRIMLCNGNRPTARKGLGAIGELTANFYTLDEEAIRRIACPFGVTYYVGRPRQTLGFALVHTTSSYAVYKIDCHGR